MVSGGITPTVVAVGTTHAYKVGDIEIVVQKRLVGWMAHLPGNPDVWEAGGSLTDAIGSLFIKLSAREMPK